MEIGDSVGQDLASFGDNSASSAISPSADPIGGDVSNMSPLTDDSNSLGWGMTEFMNIIVVILTSTLAVYFGALNSRHFLRNYNILTDSNEKSSESVQPVLEAKGAILMPIMGSITLITLYYLFTNLQFFILCYIVVASYASTTFCFTVPTLIFLTKVENWCKNSLQNYRENKVKGFGNSLNDRSIFQALPHIVLSFLKFKGARRHANSSSNFNSATGKYSGNTNNVHNNNSNNFYFIETETSSQPFSSSSAAENITYSTNKSNQQSHRQIHANITSQSHLAKQAVYVSGILSIIIIFAWMYTGSWILNNILGLGLCISMIGTLKIKSLKIAAICLCSLFFYDIFWVFYSSNFFGENVMVEVATKAASNPIHEVGKSLDINVIKDSSASSLQLPLKLIFPTRIGDAIHMSMLGLGDIALPGLLVAFALSFDDYLNQTKNEENRNKSWKLISNLTYFRASTIGYLFGICMSMFCSRYFKAAQPALLYLVPCTLGPILIIGQQRYHLHLLWEGFSIQENQKQPLPQMDTEDEESGSRNINVVSHHSSETMRRNKESIDHQIMC